jgi:hypothetical protein
MELDVLKYDLNGIEISKIEGEYWAMVYKDKELILDIFYCSGITQTPWSIYVSTTEDECVEYRNVITGKTDTIIE